MVWVLIMNNGGSTINPVIDIILRNLWVPIIVPIILIFLKFVFKDRLLWIKEIKKQTGADAESFISLYNSRIDDSIKICPEEILRYVRKNIGVIEHHLYVCKRINKTVGFIKFMISKELSYLFVAYVGIDNNDPLARENAIKMMVNKLAKKYYKPQKATSIFLEIDKSKNGEYLTALARLVSRYALSIEKEAYYINIPYIQPIMPDENYDGIDEKTLSLIYIPYYIPENRVLDKGMLLRIIKSIYNNIYEPCCNSLSDNCSKYNDYLERILKGYQDNLPENIEIIKL